MSTPYTIQGPEHDGDSTPWSMRSPDGNELSMQAAVDLLNEQAGAMEEARNRMDEAGFRIGDLCKCNACKGMTERLTAAIARINAVIGDRT